MLLCGFASDAAAQITLEAGEHDSFTRLVATGQTAGTLQIERRNDVVSISPVNLTQADIANLVRRLNGGRVAEIRSVGREITFQVACDCSIWTSDLTNAVVIDILDVGTSPPRVALAVPPSQLSEAVGALADPGNANDGMTLQERTDLSNALLSELSIADRAGRITLREPATASTDVTFDDAPLRVLPRTDLHLHQECADPVAIPEEVSPDLRLLDARAGLAQIVREFDRVDTSRLVMLGYDLLYLGLTDEVRLLLASFGERAEQLLYLADVLDGTTVRGDIEVNICGDGALLWRLAAGDMLSDTEVDLAIGSLGQTDPYFRRLIGPRVLETLLERREFERFDRVAAQLQRSGVQQAPLAKLLVAEGLIQRGAVDQALPLLHDLAAGRSAVMPDALARLLEVILQIGAVTEDRLLIDAQAAMRLLAGSAAGNRLLRLVIHSLAKSGRIALAFETMEDAFEQGHLVEADRGEIIAATLTTGIVSDPDYVPIALSYAAELGRDASGADARLHVAEILLQAGLPTPAIVLVEPLADNPRRAAFLQSAASFGLIRDQTNDFDLVEASTLPEPEPARATVAPTTQNSSGAAVERDLLAATEALRQQLQGLISDQREVSRSLRTAQ